MVEQLVGQRVDMMVVPMVVRMGVTLVERLDKKMVA